VADKPNACETPEPTEGSPLSISLACSSAKALVAGGLPSAVSTGTVGDLGLSANTVLAALPVTQPLQDGVNTIFDGLAPLFALDPNLENAGTTVQDLLTDVITTDTLRVRAGGPSVAQVTTEGDKVTAASSTTGIIVDLLPTGAVGDLPVATIEVGAATATASYARGDGKATPAFEAALVKVTIAEEILAALPPDLVAALPFEGNVLSITVTDTTCLPLPEPLTSCITVGGGNVTENEDGSVTAMAAGVSLDLLKGLQGGVQLELASARATAGGTPAVAAVAQPTLPRTGGNPGLPLAGVVLLGLAAATFVLSRGRRRAGGGAEAL
jgi:LPXTG-motif cell wall-anchored protein